MSASGQSTCDIDSSLRQYAGQSSRHQLWRLSIAAPFEPGTRRPLAPDLAERLALTASGVTRTLLPLEKIGLVTRQPDPRDARVGYAVVTSAGQEIYANALGTAQMISQDLLKDSADAQLDAFSALLAKIAGLNLSNS